MSELHWSDRPLHWDLPFICQSTSSSGGASKQLNRHAAVTGTTLGLLSTMCTVCSVVIADRALRAVFSTLSVCYPTPMSIMQIFYRPTPIIGRFLVHPYLVYVCKPWTELLCSSQNDVFSRFFSLHCQNVKDKAKVNVGRDRNFVAALNLENCNDTSTAGRWVNVDDTHDCAAMSCNCNIDKRCSSWERSFTVIGDHIV